MYRKKNNNGMFYFILFFIHEYIFKFQDFLTELCINMIFSYVMKDIME